MSVELTTAIAIQQAGCLVGQSRSQLKVTIGLYENVNKMRPRVMVFMELIMFVFYANCKLMLYEHTLVYRPSRIYV